MSTLNVKHMLFKKTAFDVYKEAIIDTENKNLPDHQLRLLNDKKDPVNSIDYLFKISINSSINQKEYLGEHRLKQPHAINAEFLDKLYHKILDTIDHKKDPIKSSERLLTFIEIHRHIGVAIDEDKKLKLVDELINKSKEPRNKSRLHFLFGKKDVEGLLKNGSVETVNNKELIANNNSSFIRRLNTIINKTYDC